MAAAVGGTLAATDSGISRRFAKGMAPSRPAALANYATWRRYRNWDFGSNTGNDIRNLSDFTNAGWGASNSKYNRPSEIQTFYTGSVLPADCPNFVVHPDHVDIVAIWNGREIAPGSNGNVTSIQTMFPVDLHCGGLTSIAYIEGTFRCPNVSGAWPAWWTIGHRIGQAYDETTWGPEIDIMEIFGSRQISNFACTLHAADNANNRCFLSGSGPHVPAGMVDYTNSQGTVSYDASGAANWNLGSFNVDGVINSADGYHRYGCLIEPDHTISIWIDDLKIGHFAATQYCSDAGVPVALQLVIDLALSSEDAGRIDPADFGGPNNTHPTNNFRLGIRNIQIWGPAS
ncbi:MAG TPA: hypothetical protein VMU22_01455 [Rhizomicrobium sp.]|nr:hypothetical protein [Rhizomicrobium sp.]